MWLTNVSASRNTHFVNCVNLQQLIFVSVTPSSGRDSSSRLVVSWLSRMSTTFSTLNTLLSCSLRKKRHHFVHSKLRETNSENNSTKVLSQIFASILHQRTNYIPGTIASHIYRITSGIMCTFSKKHLLKVWVHIIRRKEVLRCLGKHQSSMKSADALINGNRRNLLKLNHLYWFNLFNWHLWS